MNALTRYILGIDIGTQGTKGLLVSVEGEVVARLYESGKITRKEVGQAEQDPETSWWQSFCHVAKGLMGQSGASPNQIMAVGCCAMSPNVAFLDEHMNVLRPALLYCDQRVPEAGDLSDRRLNGAVRPGSIAARLLWVQKHQPEIWNQVRYTPTTTSYLVEKLTGHLSIDRPTAQGYGSLFDLSNGRWDMAECERLGLSAELFPQEIVGSRDIVGTMTEQAACSTGLAQGIPVIAGTIDAFAEMLSAAVVAPGDACLLYGSFVALLVARVRRRLSDGPIHCLEDLAFDGAGVQTGGALIRWFRDTFARAELQVENEGGQNAYATLDELAEAIPPGAEGLLALPRFEGSPGGAWFGLTLGHRREHLYRSLLEGIAFEVRRQLEEEHVAIPSQLVAVGGGSQSQLWTQIMSDVLGVTQLCTEYPLGAPLGIAYLAGMGAGLISGFERLKNQWLRVGRVVQPELAERFVYDRAYRAYCQEFQQRFGQQGAN